MISIEVINGYVNAKTRRKNYVLNQNLIEKVLSRITGAQIDLKQQTFKLIYCNCQ